MSGKVALATPDRRLRRNVIFTKKLRICGCDMFEKMNNISAVEIVCFRSAIFYFARSRSVSAKYQNKMNNSRKRSDNLLKEYCMNCKGNGCIVRNVHRFMV